MFALIDCNNFYASCERVFRPDLRHTPIVVLSNNDGCVIARSNEAKDVGIPMGAPAFKYKQAFETHRVQVFSANFALYGDMSHRVFRIVQEFSPDVEIYSIDEAFLKFDGFDLFHLPQYALAMQKKILQYTGIPTCVGIAPTKSLAKVANRIAKKYPIHTNQVYCIDTPQKIEKALKWLAIDDVWGVGRKYAKRLHDEGVHTAYDFTRMSSSWVKKHMSVVGLRLQQDLQGIPVLDLEQLHDKKNIATTRTFETVYTHLYEVQERVSSFAVVCAEKLRKQHSCCGAIMVFVHTNMHSVHMPQYAKSIVYTLPFATNSSIELSKFALQALDVIYKPGYAYKKAGVIVMDFVPEHQVQQNLFENSNPKHKHAMKALDVLNAKCGQHKVRLASQDSSRVWKMQQQFLSPRYTTNLHDIIVVNAR